jgi:hypothetical protein
MVGSRHDEGLLPDNAFSLHNALLAHAIGDDPLAAQQLHWMLRLVEDHDAIGKHEMPELGAALVWDVSGLDLDYNVHRAAGYDF